MGGCEAGDDGAASKQSAFNSLAAATMFTRHSGPSSQSEVAVCMLARITSLAQEAEAGNFLDATIPAGDSVATAAGRAQQCRDCARTACLAQCVVEIDSTGHIVSNGLEISIRAEKDCQEQQFSAG